MAEAALPAALINSMFNAKQQSSAAKKAASAQERAAQEAAQVQRDALQAYRLASEPFRFGGQQAINPLLSSLGIPTVSVPASPVFNLLTGEPTANRRTEIEQRLKELREQRALLGN